MVNVSCRCDSVSLSTDSLTVARDGAAIYIQRASYLASSARRHARHGAFSWSDVLCLTRATHGTTCLLAAANQRPQNSCHQPITARELSDIYIFHSTCSSTSQKTTIDGVLLIPQYKSCFVLLITSKLMVKYLFKSVRKTLT